jgi:uncharacterized damage-inducible protein DinB
MRYCFPVNTPSIKSAAITAPAATEYAPYYGRYVSLVEGNDLVAIMQEQSVTMQRFFSSISEKDAELRYDPAKWSIKQMLGHVIDTERIFAYRALCIARNDRTPLPGFEQDDYVRFGPFEHCRWADLIDEFGAVRTSNIALFRGLDEEAWMRRGTASQNEVTVRALGYMIVGHGMHHRNVLQQKYLPLLRH